MRTREVASREQWLSTVTDRMIHAEAEVERLRGALQMLADWWDEGDAPIHPGALIDGDSDRTVKDLIHAALAGESGI